VSGPRSLREAPRFDNLYKKIEMAVLHPPVLNAFDPENLEPKAECWQASLRATCRVLCLINQLAPHDIRL
jgi:hypothetical protein